MMRSIIIRKSFIILIILAPMLIDFGCKKQPRCGCGKDVIFSLEDGEAIIYYNEASRSAYFYPVVSDGATYYFCNPERWLDTLKTLDTKQSLLVSGDVFYECSYLYNSSNYYYQIPPVYQVDVTSIKVDNYRKKK